MLSCFRLAGPPSLPEGCAENPSRATQQDMAVYWDCTRAARGWAFGNSAGSPVECNLCLSHPHDARGPSGRPAHRYVQQARYGSRATSNAAGRRAGARAASNAGLWKERGARMAHTESILNLLTSACYEPMALCICEDLSNPLPPDAHSAYANSMQQMQ